MKKTLFQLSCSIVSALAVCSVVSTRAQTMAIDSLSGPVTQNEINTFEAFMASKLPQQSPWGARNGTTGDHNEWADGTGGRELEALAQMYEATGDSNILTNMVGWADICTSQRNDLMSAANGGQRVMWTGNIDEVWCPNEPTSSQAGYAGSENEDVEGHIAYCAKAILENPSIWNTTVPDGDPLGYGATYLDRAKNYLSKCDQANDEYSLKYFIQSGTLLLVGPSNPNWTKFGQNVDAFNREMMFMSGFQRLAEAHEILGDNPSRVAQYDAIVKANVSNMINKILHFAGNPKTVKGQTCYSWPYNITDSSGTETTEIHGEYDVLGFWRAFNRASYQYPLSEMAPFANTEADVMYLGSLNFSANVGGGGGTQGTLYDGWYVISEWNTQLYTIVCGSAFTNGWYKGNAGVDAAILATKNRRFQEFSVSAAPASQTVSAGSQTTYTVTITRLGGFSGTVTLSAGLPSGTSAQFSPSSVNLSSMNYPSTNVTMTVSTSSSTPGGNNTLTITGTSGSVSQSATVNLDVSGSTPDFSVSATPPTQSVQVGDSTSYTVNLGNINGFTGTISLSSSGSPTGANASFNPSSLTAPGSSTMTVTTSSSTPAANSTLTITGTSGSLSHMTNVTLQVTDFSLSVSPSSLNISQGGNGTATITVNPINGFSGAVSLSVSGLPTGVTSSLNPQSTTGTSTLTLTVSSTAATGTTTVTVTGTTGSLTHSTTISLTIGPAGGGLPPGWTDTDIGAVGMAGSASFSSGTFTVSGSGSDIWTAADQFNYAYESVSGDQTVIARVVSENGTQSFAKAAVMIRETLATNSVEVSTLLTPTNGVAMEVRPTTGAATINLTGWIKGPVPPQWVKLVRSGSTFTASYSADGSTWTQIATTNVTMNTSATAGLAVTAHSTASLNTATFDNVSITGPAPNFSLSASPTSLTIAQGGNGTSTITVNPVNGYNNTVTFSASGMPTGVTASFNPSSSTTGSTLTLTASSTATTGPATITVSGTDGTLTNTTTISLTVSGAPDFSLSASPNSLTITQGANGTSTITVNPLNGYNNTVSFSASGMPTGVTASFNPSSSTTSSTLTLTASSTATTGGPVTVTVTGTDGTLTHTTGISLTVNAASTNNFLGTYKLQNEASGLVLNNQGSLTNGSAITQWTSTTVSTNLDWTFIVTSNGYYQINSAKSGLDAVVQGASTTNGAGIIQWSFGSAGNDQWKPVANSDGSYTFFNLKSGLVLGDPGSSTNKTTQMDQETSTGGSNQKWTLLKQ